MERIWTWLAWRLPRRLVYFAAIRFALALSSAWRASIARWYHFSRDDHEGGHSGAQSRQSGASSAGWARGSAMTRGGKTYFPDRAAVL